MLGALLEVILIAGVLGTGPLDATAPREEPMVATARIAECGVGSVRPTVDETLQEDVVEIVGATSASEEQLRCIALASLDTRYYVIVPLPMQQAYDALYWRLSKERDLRDARSWLEERGLLSRLPIYDPHSSDELAFTRELETLCGPKAEGVLKSLKGMATINADTVSSGKLEEEALWCLVNAAAASGYPLGFVGNEQYHD